MDRTDQTATSALTRRALLARGAALSLSSGLAGGALVGAPAALAARARRRRAGLPSPDQVRAAFTQMVDFGPRLTASQPHADYIAWLEHEFAAAGLQVRA